ncbi:uncharacterized protein [Engystomops pustulosus]|uniref:uncharacterized protein n=1 Tax=Engystomops pustulosus TaxID=76066 RepID=UPI003AFA2D06
MLRTLTPAKRADWPKLLPELVYLYNNTTHCSTGYTPYYLMFGRHGHLPADMTWDMESPDSQSLLPQTDWVHEHQRRLADAREVVDLRLEEAREKQKRDFDRNACAEPFAPGDRVWLRNNHPTSKLDGRWEREPYLVRDSLSPEVYEISRGDRPLLRVHRNRLKRCLRPFAPLSTPLTSTPNLQTSLCSPTPSFLELVTVPQFCFVSTPVRGTSERPSSPPQSPILLPVEDDPAPLSATPEASEPAETPTPAPESEEDDEEIVIFSQPELRRSQRETKGKAPAYLQEYQLVSHRRRRQVRFSDTEVLTTEEDAE